MDNHYFCEYDDEDDEYIVYFGHTSSSLRPTLADFNASWIASFINEEDATEYADYKNDLMEQNNQEANDAEKYYVDPEWDEVLEEDLVEHFGKDFID